MQNILSVLEMMGVIAFSISGAMAAIEENLDIFGVVFLGVITSFGGGIIRDVLLGNLPPLMFQNYHCVMVSVLVAFIVFFFAYLVKDYYSKSICMMERINNLIDAIGLGIFSITGVQIASGAEGKYNWVLLICIGITTGVGGGLVRDIILARTPIIFTKHIYAIASGIGCIVFLMAMKLSVSEPFAIAISITTIFVIRILASIFRWDLPKVSIKKLDKEEKI